MSSDSETYIHMDVHVLCIMYHVWITKQCHVQVNLSSDYTYSLVSTPGDFLPKC